MDVTFFLSLAPFRVDLINMQTNNMTAISIKTKRVMFLPLGGHFPHSYLELMEYPSIHSTHRVPV